MSMTKDAAMYYRIFSLCLEPDRNWYAYYCLPGSRKSNRNNGNKYILQCFPHEFKRVNIKTERPKLQDYNGNPVPFRWFLMLDGKSLKLTLSRHSVS